MEVIWHEVKQEGRSSASISQRYFFCHRLKCFFIYVPGLLDNTRCVADEPHDTEKEMFKTVPLDSGHLEPWCGTE